MGIVYSVQEYIKSEESDDVVEFLEKMIEDGLISAQTKMSPEEDCYQVILWENEYRDKKTKSKFTSRIDMNIIDQPERSSYRYDVSIEEHIGQHHSTFINYKPVRVYFQGKCKHYYPEKRKLVVKALQEKRKRFAIWVLKQWSGGKIPVEILKYIFSLLYSRFIM